MYFLYERWVSKRRAISAISFNTNITGMQSRLWAAVFCIGWLVSYAYIFHLTLVKYPEVTKRDWQFEISAAMKCAKEKRKNETIVLSPQFQAVHTFALFHLSDVFEHEAPEKRGWEIGRRRKISPDELYVTPATGARPIGDAVCTIRSKNTPIAYVYKSKPKVDPKEINNGKPLIKPKFPRRPFPTVPVNTPSITTKKTAVPQSPQERPQKR